MIDKRVEIRPDRFVHIYQYQHPTSDTTLFMFHGLGGRGDQWREQIPVLKEKFSLIIPDLLGHGRSDKPKPLLSNPYSFVEIAEDVEAIFNQFSTLKNIVIAHSYGSTFSTFLTVNHQDKITKLILISPIPCMPKTIIPFLFKCPIILLELMRPFLSTEFRKMAFSASANPQLIADETEEASKNPMYMIKSIVAGMKDIPKLDVTELKVPTLLILSTGDKVVPLIHSQQFYRAIPHHKVVMIDPGSHMYLLENSEKVNNIIMNFLVD